MIDASMGDARTIRFEEGSYRAGACNIGTREIAVRRAAGISAIAGAGILALVIVVAGAPPALRWVVALPLFGGFVGLLQARRRFCVNYALRGLSNFGSSDETASVADAADRAADRRAALRLIALAGGAAVAATALLVVLPI